MGKSTTPYNQKKKIVVAITERRLTEDIEKLFKEYKISSSTFYAWREEVTDTMKKNKKSNERDRKSNEKDKKAKNLGVLSFNFSDINMEIKNGSITFENAKVTIIDNNVHFTGTGIVYRN